MTAGRGGNLAVIGRRDELLPFRALGARVFVVETLAEARAAMRQCASGGFPVIMVSDDLLSGMGDIIEEYASSALPAITALPGPGGDTRYSGERLNDLVKKAIGLDIRG